MYRFFPYYFDEQTQILTPIKFNYSTSCSNIHNTLSKGIGSQEELNNAKAFYGPCQIDVPYKGICAIFIDEILSPFYLFQVFYKLLIL